MIHFSIWISEIAPGGLANCTRVAQAVGLPKVMEFWTMLPLGRLPTTIRYHPSPPTCSIRVNLFQSSPPSQEWRNTATKLLPSGVVLYDWSSLKTRNHINVWLILLYEIKAPHLNFWWPHGHVCREMICHSFHPRSVGEFFSLTCCPGHSPPAYSSDVALLSFQDQKK